MLTQNQHINDTSVIVQLQKNAFRTTHRVQNCITAHAAMLEEYLK